MSKIFTDQQSMAFAVRQSTHIERELNKQPLPDIVYPRLIPVDNTAHPFATSVDFYSSDQYGKAGWINGNSDDIPMAGTNRAKHTTGVYTSAIGYGWGWEELNQAQMLGVDLSGEDAAAARRAAEEMTEGVALRGDEEKGMQGLINHSEITPGSALTGDWAGATTDEDQILADVNDAIFAVAEGTNYTMGADTVLLPFKRMNLLGTTYRRDKTLLQLIMESNAYTLQTGRPLTIMAVRGLDKAGAGETNRMVAYKRDPAVLKMHIPMPHRFLPVWQQGPLNWQVPGVMRLGGLDIRRTAGVVYRDGL